MRSARVLYHHDPDGWWAESPEIPGYTGFGESYEAVRDEMREGLPWFAEQDLLLFHIDSIETAQGTKPAAKVSIDITRAPRTTYRPLGITSSS